MPTKRGHQIKGGIKYLLARKKHRSDVLSEGLSFKNDILIYICVKEPNRPNTNPQKQKIKEVPVYTCLHSQNRLGKSWVLALFMKILTWNPGSGGNPFKEKTDSTISNVGITMPTEKHFQWEITNGPGRNCFPKQLCSPHKRKMCFFKEK